jgi:hypothetical protein
MQRRPKQRRHAPVYTTRDRRAQLTIAATEAEQNQISGVRADANQPAPKGASAQGLLVQIKQPSPAF